MKRTMRWRSRVSSGRSGGDLEWERDRLIELRRPLAIDEPSSKMNLLDELEKRRISV